MKVIIMAGGTGGHIFPAAAVADALTRREHEILWLGARKGMENTLVPKQGYTLLTLPVSAWHGGALRKFLAPVNMLRALAEAWFLFNKHKPDLVIGFGGFATGPGAVMALIKKVPLLLHEQNSVPGLTNEKLHRKASVVLQAFPNTFAENYEVVGNPVREGLAKVTPPNQKNRHRKLHLLVLGGSQGAQAINDVLPQAVQLCKQTDQIEIWHQTGADKLGEIEALYDQVGVEATVVEFIQDMAVAFDWADLVISRSGASTVSELAAVGRYSILVPYPWHKDRQQYKNAEWLINHKAAELLEQKNLSAKTLSERISYWFTHREELAANASNAWQVGIRDSAQRIAHVCEKLQQGKLA